MKKTLFTAAASIFLLCATEAMAQDSVAVMKLDATGDEAESQSALVLDALRNEVVNSNRILDANGSDITYTEMQMLTGCDREASIACYEAACETLGSHAIIFGSINSDGQASLVWYVSGKGIFREVAGPVTDKASAEKLAQRMVVGEMGTLVVTSNVPGADVFIDGKRVGMSSDTIENAQPLTLLAGNYIVSVRKEGYEKSDAVKVEVVGGEQAKLNVDLIVALDESKLTDTLKIAGWSSLGVGAACLIGAGVIEGLQYKEQKDIDDAIMHPEDHPDYKYNSSNDKGRNFYTIKVILYGVGALGAAAGVTLVTLGYFMNFDSDEAITNAAIPSFDFTATPEYSGFNLGWKF